jgi:hypothetical protein
MAVGELSGVILLASKAAGASARDEQQRSRTLTDWEGEAENPRRHLRAGMYDKCVLVLSTWLDTIGRNPVAPFGPEAGVDLQWKCWQSEDMLNGEYSDKHLWLVFLDTSYRTLIHR